jgi:N-acetylneuraminic acid mutarotase
MNHSFQRTLATFMALAVGAATVASPAQEHSSTAAGIDLKWEKLPPIPDGRGLGSPYAGVAGGALVVGGGANFPTAPPWEGGTKVWYDNVYALEKADGEWKSVGKLPQPMAGAVALTTEDGVACFGGGDAKRCYDDSFVLRYENGGLDVQPLPKLPKPCVNAAGVLLGSTVYIAGGIERPDATATLKTFWSLDLGKPSAGWRELEPCPGPGRLLSTMGTLDGAVYLFSGADLTPGRGSDGKPERVWLMDAYRYQPGQGWRKLADLPRVAVAPPGPALAMGKSQLLILGGDDGAQVATPPSSHVGFRRDVLAYDVIRDAWTTAGKLPFAIVTTSAVRWNDLIVVPGGEIRPAVRTTEVWAAKVEP